MSRYIDAEKLTKEEQSLEDIGQGVMEYYAVEEIENAPTADVRENVHGHWIKIITAYGIRWQCTKCEHYIDNGMDRNFCPNCGAKMRGVDNEAD